jgi:hypothetical protein
MGLPLVFRVRDKESMQRSNADSNGSDGGCLGFSGKHPRLASRFRVSELREVCRDQTQRQHGSDNGCKNGDEPPSRLNSWVKLHVPGPTHVAHEAACTPSSMCSLFQELRIKIYLSHHFGIIINYYSRT